LGDINITEMSSLTDSKWAI